MTALETKTDLGLLVSVLTIWRAIKKDERAVHAEISNNRG